MRLTRSLTLLGTTALMALAACDGFDPDLRRAHAGFSTADAAREVTAQRPSPDERGVITYPDYQVVVARSGDTVGAVASRVGMSAEELASFNALRPETRLRSGEVLALPRGTAAQPGRREGEIEVATLAESAIDRAEAGQPSAATRTQPAEAQPVRHRVERGETAFTIARLYNVTPRALAEWNGLDPEMRVREGQVLMIPVAREAAARQAQSEPTPPPGSGSPTPAPPSAATPMPAEDAPPAAESQARAEQERPQSPQLSQERTEASRAGFVMPVDGRIIRAYAPGRNEGIGIAASAGTDVRAAAAGTVAAITRTTGNVNVMVIRHDDGLLTVYANIDELRVDRNDRIRQGQSIGKVAAGDPSFLHFEIRRGQDSIDPMTMLQ